MRGCYAWGGFSLRKALESSKILEGFIGQILVSLKPEIMFLLFIPSSEAFLYTKRNCYLLTTAEPQKAPSLLVFWQKYVFITENILQLRGWLLWEVWAGK